MRAWPAAVAVTLVVTAGATTGCESSTSDGADFRVGDCLKLGGNAGRPEATKVPCGSRLSAFRVVKVLATADGDTDRGQCPADVDSSYSVSVRNAFSDSRNTACLDIDWVVGGCMSVDPANTAGAVRVDCNDRSIAHRQRAVQILRNLQDPVSVDQCASGVGYAYAQRRFAVCVEDIA
jgi:hypothetical protein